MPEPSLIAALATTAALGAVFVGLCALGAAIREAPLLIGRRSGGGFPAADPIVGLGVAASLISVITTWTPWPVSWVEIGVGGLLVAALGGRLIAGRPAASLELAAALVGCLPLLALAATIPARHWDDFMHWLPNAAYLYRFDHLPALGGPAPLSRWPGYPHTFAFLTVGVSWLVGRFTENVAGLFNIGLIATGGVAVLAAINEARGPGSANQWRRAAWAVLLSQGLLLFHLGSDYRTIVLSNCGDVATGVVTAILALLAWLALIRSSAGGDDDAEINAILRQFAGAALALVSLKQANLIILGLVMAGSLVPALRQRTFMPGRTARRLAVALIPAVAVHLTWEHYVAINLPDGEMRFFPLAEWHFDLIETILLSFTADRIGANPGLYVGFLFCATVGSIGVLRRVSMPEYLLMSIFAVVFAGYVGFLLIVYLGAMRAWEAVATVELPRYMLHVSFLCATALAVYFVGRYHGAIAPPARRDLVWAAIALMPISFATNLAALVTMEAQSRPTREALAALASTLSEAVAGDATVLMVTNDRQYQSLVLQYELWWRGGPAHQLRVMTAETVDDADFERIVKGSLTDARISHLIVTPGNVPDDDDIDLADSNKVVILEKAPDHWRPLRALEPPLTP